MQKHLKLFAFLTMFLIGQGCMSNIQSKVDSFPDNGTVLFGRIQVVLTGPTTRWYEPRINFIELYNQTIDQRFRVDIESNESLLVFPLPDGDYQLTRVQIGEGGFRGMANLSVVFHIQPDTVNYVGTWKFSVASPFYDRDLALTVSSELVQTLSEAYVVYPDLQNPHITITLPTPTEIQTRLFEVTPYPRVRWFQRRSTS